MKLVYVLGMDLGCERVSAGPFLLLKLSACVAFLRRGLTR